MKGYVQIELILQNGLKGKFNVRPEAIAMNTEDVETGKALIWFDPEAAPHITNTPMDEFEQDMNTAALL